MIPTWKLNIFVRAIRTRMDQESRTAAEIIEEYTALSSEEKAEILQGI